MTTEEKMRKIMRIVDDNIDDDSKLCIHRMLNDGHLDEWSATYMTQKMIPVAWLGAEYEPSNMSEYLSMRGITPKVACDMVHDAYHKAIEHGAHLNIDAPHVDANEWDCYWCMAMMLSDYWITCEGDLDAAAMMAYEYLSDPDR